VAAVVDAGAAAAASTDAGTLELAMGDPDAGVAPRSDPSSDPPSDPPPADLPPDEPGPSKKQPVVDAVSDAPLRQLQGQWRARGLRAGDVPAFDTAIAQGQQAVRARNKAGVAAATTAAKAALAGVEIDKAFVSKKLARFNRAFADAKDAALKEQLKPLSKDVLGRIGKGDWRGANEALNTGFTKLARGR
jgi:hypothetical protein